MIAANIHKAKLVYLWPEVINFIFITTFLLNGICLLGFKFKVVVANLSVLKYKSSCQILLVYQLLHVWHYLKMQSLSYTSVCLHYWAYLFMTFSSVSLTKLDFLISFHCLNFSLEKIFFSFFFLRNVLMYQFPYFALPP